MPNLERAPEHSPDDYLYAILQQEQARWEAAENLRQSDEEMQKEIAAKWTNATALLEEVFSFAHELARLNRSFDEVRDFAVGQELDEKKRYFRAMNARLTELDPSLGDPASLAIDVLDDAVANLEDDERDEETARRHL
jgi:hypothetical protein